MQHFQKYCFGSCRFVLGFVFLTYHFTYLILMEIQKEKKRKRKSKWCEISRRQEVLQIQNITVLKTTEWHQKIEFAHQNIKIK